MSGEDADPPDEATPSLERPFLCLEGDPPSVERPLPSLERATPTLERPTPPLENRTPGVERPLTPLEGATSALGNRGKAPECVFSVASRLSQMDS